MATENKKYLDLTGLQHLLNKLNDANRIVPHATDKAKAEAFYKIQVDANGHVVSATPVALADLTGLGAAATTDIKNSTIKIKINGVEKDFTTNQASNETLEFTISASDLGVDTALHFKGVVSSTSEVTDPHNGDVCLVGNKEYIYSDSKWYELGDAESHALKTVKVEGDGVYIINSGNGTLAGNNKFEHKLYSDAKAKGAYKVAIDTAGHVSEAEALTIANDGVHNHTASVTIPGSSFGTSITPNTTKLSVSSTGGSTETVVTGYSNTTSSKLATTSITGVSGSVTASKATEGTAKDIAKAGTAVTVATKASTATTVGNANKATTATTVLTGVSVTNDKNAYHASYNSTDECLELSAVTLTVTPTTKGIYEAVASETEIFGCGTDTTVVPAVSNGTITPYTFSNVTVPVAATTATTVATGKLSATATGDSLLVSLGTPSTASVVKTEKTYSIASGTSGVSVMTGATLNKGTDSTATVTVNDAGSHNHDFN